MGDWKQIAGLSVRGSRVSNPLSHEPASGKRTIPALEQGHQRWGCGLRVWNVTAVCPVLFHIICAPCCSFGQLGEMLPYMKSCCDKRRTEAIEWR